MENENLIRIQSVSGKFNALFSFLIICVPVSILLFWLFFNSLPAGFKNDLPVSTGNSLSFLTLSLAFLVCMIPGSVTVYALLTLKKLFKLYEKAVVFSASNVDCFRRLGYTLIFWVIAKLISMPLLSIVLSLANPPGERQLVAGIGATDIGTLVIGAIIVVISWVMNEACKLNDEQAYTV
jgi:DUF2975 family protein